MAKRQRHGEGTYTNPNGDNFAGAWLDGLQQTGEGTTTYSDTGAVYTGNAKRQRHGGLILILMVIILLVLGLRLKQTGEGTIL